MSAVKRENAVNSVAIAKVETAMLNAAAANDRPNLEQKSQTK